MDRALHAVPGTELHLVDEDTRVLLHRTPWLPDLMIFDVTLASPAHYEYAGAYREFIEEHGKFTCRSTIAIAMRGALELAALHSGCSASTSPVSILEMGARALAMPCVLGGSYGCIFSKDDQLRDVMLRRWQANRRTRKSGCSGSGASVACCAHSGASVACCVHQQRRARARAQTMVYAPTKRFVADIPAEHWRTLQTEFQASSACFSCSVCMFAYVCGCVFSKACL
jgi:hypothetical protein